jgi:CTP synthase (UTP-ammonia lyase)
MDSLMMSIFYSDVYGVSEAVAKEFTPQTPAEMVALMKEHKTKEPASIDEAVGAVQW